MTRNAHIRLPVADNQPTILYVDCSLHSGIDRRRLDGLRRYAAARKWRVETLEHRDCTPAALREALARLHPIGCASECWCPETAPRPPLFGRTPVVYFEPPDGSRWRGVHGVTCDNAAVGRTTFAGHDPCEQFAKYPGRSPTLHAKENGTDEPGFDAILGRPAAGKPGVNWAGLIPVAEKDGVEWFVVECERHFDSLEAITPSFEFLSAAMA